MACNQMQIVEKSELPERGTEGGGKTAKEGEERRLGLHNQSRDKNLSQSPSALSCFCSCLVSFDVHFNFSHSFVF